MDRVLLVMLAGLALLGAGCTPCRQNADCGEGMVCAQGSCKAIAACTVGQTAPCVCDTGVQGTQVCQDDGATFGACVCEDRSCGALGCTAMPDVTGKSLDEAGKLLREAGLKLPDAIDPNGFIVERRVNDPPVQVLEQFPVAGGRIPKGTAPTFRVTMPPDQEYLGLPNSAFLVGLLAQDDEQSAQAYYDAIDPGPTPSRATLADWKEANGFGQPSDDEASAIYVNKTDLGFGRHMHMRRKGDHVAFYVDNYPSLEDAVNNTRMFATVAMEWTPPAGNPGGRRFTKFFTFNKKGERIYDPALDSHGIKMQPGVCLACHGGAITDLKYSNGGDMGARFIPFDLDALLFSTRKGYTRADQELAFKKFNQAVKQTYPADDPAFPPSDPSPVPELIEGWYGGPGMPSPYFDGTFVPPAWGVDNDAWDIYLDVFAKSCRTCHAQREGFRNFSTYEKFWAKKGMVHQRVFEDGAMPLSEKGAMNFWLSSPGQPDLLAQWIGKPLSGPGKPVARVRVTNNGLIRPGDAVNLDASESQYTQRWSWSQASGPSVTLVASESGATFVAPSPAATIGVKVTARYGSMTSDASASIQVVDNPTVPRNVTAAPGVRSAIVSWTAPAFDGNSTIASYTVTSSAGGTPVTVDVPATQATITGLADGASVTFTVTAKNAVGLSSAASSPSAAINVHALPGAPRTVTGVSGNGQVTVSWLAPLSNGGSAITGYTVTAGPGGATATTTGATSVAVTGLANGTAYTFTVTATTAVGTGPASAASAPVTPATVAGQPTGVTATRGNAQATIAWTAPASNGGAAVTGYTLNAFTTSGCGSPPCATALAASSSCTTTSCNTAFTGLTNGTGYQFTVKAVNSAGTGSASSFSNAVTPATVPGAPTLDLVNNPALPGNGQATVQWNKPADNGDAITSYTISAFIIQLSDGSLPSGCSAAPCSTAISASSNCSTSSCSSSVTGLTNGTTYKFTVKATNGVGTGPASSLSNQVTPGSTPGAPSAPQSVSATGGTNQATITWTAPVDSGSPTATISSYTITASPGGASTSAAGNATSKIMSGLTGGISYTFSVTATNSNNLTGPAGTSSSVAVVGPPQPPTGVTATRGDGSASVSWTAPTNNGGSAILSYTATSSPGGFTGTTANGTTTNVTVSGLVNGTAYTFTVVATNTHGSSSPSAASSSVTPAGVPTAPSSVTATSGDGQVTVGWNVGSTNGSAFTTTTINRYNGTSTCSGAVSATSSSSCTSSPCSATVTGLTNGTTYSFTVFHTNSVGAGTLSSCSGGATPAGLPGIPNLSVSAGAAALTATFSANSSNANGASIDSLWVDLCTSGQTCTSPGLCSGGSPVLTGSSTSPKTFSSGSTVTACAYSGGSSQCTWNGSSVVSRTFKVCAYQHNAVGWGSATSSTVAPLVSYVNDNLTAIWTDRSCRGCHAGHTPNLPSVSNTTTERSSILSWGGGNVIWSCPQGTGSWTGCMSPQTGWSNGTGHVNTLRRWVADGQLQ